jgi:hypothetical protein
MPDTPKIIITKANDPDIVLQSRWTPPPPTNITTSSPELIIGGEGFNRTIDFDGSSYVTEEDSNK